jgi:demethylmenaquinone methyltransferase/2-methoxy-6-polyprenyl-1,4-benzoquinol methylase
VDADELIAAQIAYYRARATQYDDEPAHADNDQSGPQYLSRLRNDVAELDAWLEADPPTGHVLEIAAGSGNRTGRLLPAADRVTAVDASLEMLELLAAKHPEVERIEADIFSWEPPQRYDNIYFGYWISHVPAARWDSFWELVDRALVAGGRVWFMDNAHPYHANANDIGGRLELAGERRIEPSAESEVRTRRLRDGSEWTLVKRFWWPEELAADLSRLGWAARVAHSDFAFLYGTAARAR